VCIWTSLLLPLLEGILTARVLEAGGDVHQPIFESSPVRSVRNVNFPHHFPRHA